MYICKHLPTYILSLALQKITIESRMQNWRVIADILFVHHEFCRTISSTYFEFHQFIWSSGEGVLAHYH